MTELASQHTSTALPSQAPVAVGGKRYFEVEPRDWMWDTLFLLSLALTGLGMPLGNLMVLFLLFRAYMLDKEGFLVMLMLTAGGYALSQPNVQWGVNLLYAIVPAGIVGMFVLRKSPLLTKAIILYAIYAITSFVFVFISDEKFMVQLNQVINYLSFAFFTIPLMVFSGREFDLNRFWTRLFSLQLIICVFYILDAYVIRGWVLIPCSYIDADVVSTWSSPIFYGPGGMIPRKYPPGIYLMALLLFPIARYYKLRWWQWAIVIIALVSTRTFSTFFGLLVGYVVCMGTMKKYLVYGVIAIGALTILYYVDDSMGYGGENKDQSTLRIASTFNQIAIIDEAQYDEDLADAGSGRMAQAIPLLENLYEKGKEWTGFGFVGMATKNTKFQIYNELVAAYNPDIATMSVTGVEIVPIQILLEVGYIGLAIHILFMIGLWYIVRKTEYGLYMADILVVLTLFGIGGFRGFHDSITVYMGAMVFAIALLMNRPWQSPFNPAADDEKEAAPVKALND